MGSRKTHWSYLFLYFWDARGLALAAYYSGAVVSKLQLELH